VVDYFLSSPTPILAHPPPICIAVFTYLPLFYVYPHSPA
jgi:hypothetical protein